MQISIDCKECTTGTIEMTRYRSGHPCIIIRMDCDLPEVWCKVSTLFDYPLEPNEIIGDVNNARDEVNQMISKGYLIDTSKRSRSGYVSYPILRICDELMKELEEE